MISPILANVYLHYVYDLWVHRWRRTKATGDMIVVRYADDTIVGFQHEHEAKAFLHDLQERLREFELTLHPDKTRLIRFGRHAAKQREKLGEGKPETFDFLGFTHFCTRSRKWGSFVIGRKTIKKRMRAKLKAIKMELRKRMHDPIAKTGAWVKQMLQGHLNYFAVSGNDPSLWWFFNEVRWRWLKSLKRRSQKALLSLGRVHPARRPLLSANQGAAPAALSPLRRQNPREEPGALAAHAGICAGGEEQSSSLPRPFPMAALVTHDLHRRWLCDLRNFSQTQAPQTTATPTCSSFRSTSSLINGAIIAPSTKQCRCRCSTSSLRRAAPRWHTALSTYRSLLLDVAYAAIGGTATSPKTAELATEFMNSLYSFQPLRARGASAQRYRAPRFRPV